LGGLRGDAQGYSGVGGRDSAPYGSSVNRPDYGAYAGQERGLWDQTRDEVSSWFGDDEAARRRRADDMRHDLQGGEYRGEHRGRGPKGYTRSDDRIREDVSDRLTDDHMLDASDIEVKVTGGEVTLTGQIPDRYDKRRAEDLAEHVAGVKHVQNNLRVREQATTTQAGSTATTGSSGASGTGGSSARSN
jgi:osmotically-inducible protein OsmY